MRDLGVGFGYLVKGQKWVARHGRWFGFGLLPGLVTLVLYVGGLVGLGYGADDLAVWATPFADDWTAPWIDVLRGTLTALVFVFGLFLAVITFTAVTLLVGQPFYESLSEAVDRDEGGEVPESGLPLWRELWISARDSLRILLRVAFYGILLFACGFVPVVGQTVVPVLGFCVSGFFLTQELTSVALQRRGVDLKERLRLLRGRRTAALGFGVPLTLSFLVPFVAVFLMPGAVAGATLMARDLRGETSDADRNEGRNADRNGNSAESGRKHGNLPPPGGDQGVHHLPH
ncbi:MULTISPECIES: EI24 domain-containing protein [unclassified Streptomyces]|uniref:EI24 domain-containing protein n=1 Tax=unclassified Streptomyces TaxID=2593676 RepID=UPI0006B04630|nr:MULTISPECIES: EI24 domain-containing protein [unclassified Streptomyces]KOX30812.1 membrane protein [Streptomyces sp. NRRL F-6491]KOX38898.1 membrane protein [Streptomyces sp. NRRL F-6492]